MTRATPVSRTVQRPAPYTLPALSIQEHDDQLREAAEAAAQSARDDSDFLDFLEGSRNKGTKRTYEAHVKRWAQWCTDNKHSDGTIVSARECLIAPSSPLSVAGG